VTGGYEQISQLSARQAQTRPGGPKWNALERGDLLNLELFDLRENEHAAELARELRQELMKERLRLSDLGHALRSSAFGVNGFIRLACRLASPLDSAPGGARDAHGGPVEERAGSVGRDQMELASGNHEDLLRGVLGVGPR
jgi:hypothetical protein